MQNLVQFCDLISDFLNYGFDAHMVSGSLDAKGEHTTLVIRCPAWLMAMYSCY